MADIGVMLHTADLDVEHIIRLAAESAGLGYERFWLTEESGKEAFALLGALAREVPSIALGTSIVSFYSRTPTMLAMAARTVWELTSGRFMLGVGSGGPGFVERGHGLAMERPVARSRETIRIVRGLLTEKRFSYDGEWFHLKDFRLREGPLPAYLPVYLAALRPAMVRLAAREYDGFIMNWPTAEAVDAYKREVQAAASAAGRDPSEVRILSLTMTVADPGDEASVNAMRRGIAFYCASETYHHIAQLSGFGPEVRRVYEAWQTGDFGKATALVSDRMVEKFSVTTAAELQRIVDSGVYPIIYPVARAGLVYEDHVLTARRAAEYLGQSPAVS